MPPVTNWEVHNMDKNIETDHYTNFNDIALKYKDFNM